MVPGLFTGIVCTRTLSLMSGPFMFKPAHFTIQASAVARSPATCDRESRSELSSTLVRQAHHAPNSAPQVTFTADFSADASAVAQAAPADGPISPGLLRPIRRLSLPLRQSVMSANGPAPAPDVPPANVLFPSDIDIQC